MAPEIIKGDKITKAVDIYSFALTVYRILARAMPYSADSFEAIMYAQVHKDPFPIRTFNPNWPDELESVLERALSKKPELRPPTANILVNDIKDCLHDYMENTFSQFFLTPDSARTIVLNNRPRRRFRPKRYLSASLILLLAICLVIITILINNNSQSTNPKKPDDVRTFVQPPERQAIQEITKSAATPDPVLEVNNEQQATAITEPEPAVIESEEISSPVTDASPETTKAPPETTLAPQVTDIDKIRDGSYLWGDELQGKVRMLQVSLIDEIMLDEVRRPLYRNDLKIAEDAFSNVKSEERQRFFNLIENYSDTHKNIKLHYNRLREKIDNDYALIIFETGLTGISLASKNQADEILIPKFVNYAVFKKMDKNWTMQTWPSFDKPQDTITNKETDND
jgi:serine/threonine protein kinase